MQFEWDENKSVLNLAKHGISFEEAKLIFDGPVLTRADNRIDYGEVREISIGSILGAVVVVVVHTRRGRATRLISARLANRSERRRYHEHIGKTAR
ncbi:MAG: BrnT family toxin [Rhizobiaceae bacterium]